MSFWGELKRRNVFRAGAAYLVLSWLLIQVASTIAPMIGLSDAAPRFVLFVLIVLFPVMLFMAWMFEITPDGIKQTAEPAERRAWGATLVALYFAIPIVLVLLLASRARA